MQFVCVNVDTPTQFLQIKACLVFVSGKQRQVIGSNKWKHTQIYAEQVPAIKLLEMWLSTSLFTLDRHLLNAPRGKFPVNAPSVYTQSR